MGTLEARLARLESTARDQEAWRLARRSGLRYDEAVAALETNARILRRHPELDRPGITIAQAVRALAADEGLTPDETAAAIMDAEAQLAGLDAWT